MGLVSMGASTTMSWTPSWEAQEENRSSRSIFILWWWGFNSIPGNSQPLNVSEQSTRHTRDTICLICAAHSAWHVLLPVPGRSPSPITGGRECSRKRRAVWMTDHWTVSNFSCTHKSKGGGGRGAVGAAAGDSEVVLTLWVCPSDTFLWQKQAKKLLGQRPGQQQPSLSMGGLSMGDRSSLGKPSSNSSSTSTALGLSLCQRKTPRLPANLETLEKPLSACCPMPCPDVPSRPLTSLLASHIITSNRVRRHSGLPT